MLHGVVSVAKARTENRAQATCRVEVVVGRRLTVTAQARIDRDELVARVPELRQSIRNNLVGGWM
jgi:hypothetical protein